jgi:hypothetical protein
MVIRVATEEEVFEVCVWSYDTIGYMKEQVQHEREIPTGDQRYIFRGKLLQDSRTLSFYDVKAGDVLKLLPVWAPAPATATATGSASSGAAASASAAATTPATSSSSSRAPASASAAASPLIADPVIGNILGCLDNLTSRIRRIEERLGL